MPALTVWKFDDPNGAERALETLERLQKEELIDLYDGAVVTWPQGARKPKTHQMHSYTGAGALGGSFWGLLFGLIFFVPLLGIALGATLGAIGGSLSHAGIDDDFIDQVRKEVTPGSSALFVMTANAVQDKVHAAFEGQHPQLIRTNLSKDQDAALRAAFADD